MSNLKLAGSGLGASNGGGGAQFRPDSLKAEPDSETEVSSREVTFTRGLSFSFDAGPAEVTLTLFGQITLTTPQGKEPESAFVRVFANLLADISLSWDGKQAWLNGGFTLPQNGAYYPPTLAVSRRVAGGGVNGKGPVQAVYGFNVSHAMELVSGNWHGWHWEGKLGYQLSVTFNLFDGPGAFKNAPIASNSSQALSISWNEFKKVEIAGGILVTLGGIGSIILQYAPEAAPVLLA